MSAALALEGSGLEVKYRISLLKSKADTPGSVAGLRGPRPGKLRILVLRMRSLDKLRGLNGVFWR